MSKLYFRNALAVLVFAFPVAALANVTGTPTLATGSTLNLDTGATGTSGGDLSWNGTALTPQGSATAVDIASTPLAGAYTGQSGYNSLVSSRHEPDIGIWEPVLVLPHGNRIHAGSQRYSHRAYEWRQFLGGPSDRCRRVDHSAIHHVRYGNQHTNWPHDHGRCEQLQLHPCGLPELGYRSGNHFLDLRQRHVEFSAKCSPTIERQPGNS